MVVPKRKTPAMSDLDPNMVSLVKALNSFKAITTVGSCGGHADPGPAQKPLGEWSVTFLKVTLHSPRGFWAGPGSAWPPQLPTVVIALKELSALTKLTMLGSRSDIAGVFRFGTTMLLGGHSPPFYPRA